MVWNCSVCGEGTSTAQAGNLLRNSQILSGQSESSQLTIQMS
jgi:hypothetical protein